MPDQPYQKQCTRCAEVKSADNFARASQSKDGLHWWCKSCFRIAQVARDQKRLALSLVEPDPLKERRCAGCKTLKSETGFTRQRRNKDGLEYICRDCMRRRAIGRALARLEPIGPFPTDVQADAITSAYAAGFLDGEGNISIGKSCQARNRERIYYSLNVCVANTNLQVLQRLQKTYGGTICKRKDYRHLNRKDGYRWRVTSWDAVAFLKELLPFLIVKRQQAELALQFQQTVRHTGNRWRLAPLPERLHRETLYEEMKKLNQRGVIHAA
jgi:hypothetical protein